MRRTRKHEIPQSYSQEKEKIECQDYIYDGKGRVGCIVESKIRDSTLYDILFERKDTVEISENIYDASNRIIESNTYDRDRNLLGKTKYRYTGNTRKSISYDKNGDVSGEGTVINEPRKRTIANNDFYSEEQFDANGRVTQFTFCLIFGGREGIATTSYHKYNQYGDLVSTSSNLDIYLRKTGEEQHSSATSYEYEYDQMKNWVVCRKYENGKIKSIQERKIVYVASNEDFRQKVEQEKAAEKALSERIARAKYRADSIRHREDSIQRINKHRADSIRHREDSIRKIKNERKRIIRANKDYMESLVRKYFSVSSVLSVKAGLEKVKKITINDDGTISFGMKGANIPVIFTHYHSWSSGDLKATAYISHDSKYVVIYCSLDTGEPISLFNKAAILYADGKIYEMSGKIRKPFMNYMQYPKIKLSRY